MAVWWAPPDKDERRTGLYIFGLEWGIKSRPGISCTLLYSWTKHCTFIERCREESSVIVDNLTLNSETLKPQQKKSPVGQTCQQRSCLFTLPCFRHRAARLKSCSFVQLMISSPAFSTTFCTWMRKPGSHSHTSLASLGKRLDV